MPANCSEAETSDWPLCGPNFSSNFRFCSNQLDFVLARILNGWHEAEHCAYGSAYTNHAEQCNKVNSTTRFVYQSRWEMYLVKQNIDSSISVIYTVHLFSYFVSDVWMGTCIAFVFATFFEIALVHFLLTRAGVQENKAKQLRETICEQVKKCGKKGLLRILN